MSNPGPATFPSARLSPGITGAVLKSFGLAGIVTGISYGGQAVGLNLEDYTGNGFSGQVIGLNIEDYTGNGYGGGAS